MMKAEMMRIVYKMPFIASFGAFFLLLSFLFTMRPSIACTNQMIRMIPMPIVT